MNVKRLSLAVLIGLLGFGSSTLWAADSASERSQPKPAYPVLGVVIGTPSVGINAIVGYDFGRLEARLSGGIGNSDNVANGLSWGVQANLGYKSIDTRNVVGQIGVFGNYINLGNTVPSQVAGAGVAGSVFLYGFFAEAGVGVNFLPSGLKELGAIAGILDFDLQLGYVYRFN